MAKGNIYTLTKKTAEFIARINLFLRLHVEKDTCFRIYFLNISFFVHLQQNPFQCVYNKLIFNWRSSLK